MFRTGAEIGLFNGDVFPEKMQRSRPGCCRFSMWGSTRTAVWCEARPSASIQYVIARCWLLAIVAVTAVGGLASGYLAHGVVATQTALYVLIGIFICILTYSWMKADAHRRAIQPPPGATALVAMLLGIAVPYYLLGTRRGWHKLWSILFLGLFVAVLLVAVTLGELLGRRLAV
jgi:hypothetical protein